MLLKEKNKKFVRILRMKQSAAFVIVWVTCMRTSRVIMLCQIQINVVSADGFKYIVIS